jgi:hypothetical protein
VWNNTSCFVFVFFFFFPLACLCLWSLFIRIMIIVYEGRVDYTATKRCTVIEKKFVLYHFDWGGGGGGLSVLV